MKTTLLTVSAGALALLVGCASAPVASVTLAPVAPSPFAARSLSADGSLEVFSRLSRRSDDGNMGSTDPIWYQHTDYKVYDRDGRLRERVDNTVGHYDAAPTVVNLPPGEYRVQARSADYDWVNIPVTIKPGEITRVHLDGQWSPPGFAEKRQIVSLPDGRPVGWSR